MDDDRQPMGPRTHLFHYSWNSIHAILFTRNADSFFVSKNRREQKLAPQNPYTKHNNQSINHLQSTMAVKRSLCSASLHIQWIPLSVFAVIVFLTDIRTSSSFTIPPCTHEASCRRSIQSQSSRRQRTLLQKATTDKNEDAEDVNDKDNDRIQDPKFLKRNKHWVVLVDDEEAIRQSVGDFLYDEGYQVTACADADALLEVCRKPRGPGGLPAIPDAIVSDVRMPGKDGIELTEYIRADERLQRVPVILLTAKAMTQDRIAGYKAGADAYLPKPFNPDELLSILDNAILRRRQMQGQGGSMVDLKQDMASIKELLKQNGANLVKKTNVYLTPTEREVLDLLCKGYTSQEIATERGVILPGVTRVIQTLYSKTVTQTRTELVRWAIQTGYVAPR
jgi:DNA-binding response OmpR family regulator